MATSANQQGVVGAASGAIWMWTEACVILGVYSPFKMTCVCFVDLLRRHLFLSFYNTSPLLSTLFLISPACCDLVAQLVGFKNSRSGYTLGCPRPRFVGSAGMGTRSTNLTNVTSNESWDTIRVPPILVVFDYHNDRGNAWLRQVLS